ncbi:zinc-ribbon domain containing protein [Candidatus Curtissbacteria bacterium]|nr:zinc-ribbon domain containing protein [Candidatus Curtissbacteria bacterium]
MANITQTCTNCNKQFLVIDQEQAFLRQKSLPLPVTCPACRQQRRLALRGGRQLFRSKCQLM